MRGLLAAIASVTLAAGLIGCGEPDQSVVHYQQGKYQGSRDTKPWDSAPLPAEFRGGTWTKGDQKSWEEQIKNRQLVQHEHKRIYQ